MSTLLLRLEGPMQAWGTQSRFRERDTGLEPSKSGVIGLLCAALGKPRNERPGDGFPTLAELGALQLAVRADREGTVQVDYQTAGGGTFAGRPYGVRKASGAIVPGEAVLSNRYFLAGASFLVGLQGERGLLERLQTALARPVWQLCLGRKACLPASPVRLPEAPPLGPGLRDEDVVTTLTAYPWRPATPRERRRPPASLRLVLDLVLAGDGEPASVETRHDVPLSFVERRFAARRTTTTFIPLPLPPADTDVPAARTAD